MSSMIMQLIEIVISVRKVLVEALKLITIEWEACRLPIFKLNMNGFRRRRAFVRIEYWNHLSLCQKLDLSMLNTNAKFNMCHRSWLSHDTSP